jgi:hypothetical protein
MTAAKTKTSIPAESTERVRDSPSGIATRGKGEDKVPLDVAERRDRDDGRAHGPPIRAPQSQSHRCEERLRIEEADVRPEFRVLPEPQDGSVREERFVRYRVHLLTHGSRAVRLRQVEETAQGVVHLKCLVRRECEPVGGRSPPALFQAG